ncbi:BgTH12-00352 [Blumeria graminis f. sp. triticale]|uniref:BgTH12-00352 n=1 Tax=Blumeria graminis f. sp. triticale TaxID=1689686 RepID=A0A9W4D4Y5_BLUGR|nr:BgTH12-00352 [Blumeria graminis f. sp. triticale]
MMLFICVPLILVVTVAMASDDCTFGLFASEGRTGSIWQTSNGQIRTGGDHFHYPSPFRISDGDIIDSAGYGCIFTPQVRQFQCDQGVSPTNGFSIAEDGILYYEQSPNFFACPTSYQEWNIYSAPIVGQSKCVNITLTADDCRSIPSDTSEFDSNIPSDDVPTPSFLDSEVGQSTSISTKPYISTPKYQNNTSEPNLKPLDSSARINLESSTLSPTTTMSHSSQNSTSINLTKASSSTSRPSSDQSQPSGPYSLEHGILENILRGPLPKYIPSIDGMFLNSILQGVFPGLGGSSSIGQTQNNPLTHTATKTNIARQVATSSNFLTSTQGKLRTHLPSAYATVPQLIPSPDLIRPSFPTITRSSIFKAHQGFRTIDRRRVGIVEQN